MTDFALHFSLPTLEDLKSTEGQIWKYSKTFGWSVLGYRSIFELEVGIVNDEVVKLRLVQKNANSVVLKSSTELLRRIKVPYQWTNRSDQRPSYSERTLSVQFGEMGLNFRTRDEVPAIIAQCLPCSTLKALYDTRRIAFDLRAIAQRYDTNVDLPSVDLISALVLQAGNSERCICEKNTAGLLGKPVVLVFKMSSDETSTPFKCLQNKVKSMRLELLEDPCQIVQTLTLNMTNSGDAVLMCAAKEAIRAASLLLSTRSKFFEASLKYSRVDEEDVTFRLDLQKFTKAVVNVMVVFTCAGTIPDDLAELSEEDLGDLLELNAQVHAPRSEIIPFLVETELVGRGVTEENVVALVTQTELYELPTLRNICVNHLAEEPLRSFRAHKDTVAEAVWNEVEDFHRHEILAPYNPVS